MPSSLIESLEPDFLRRRANAKWASYDADVIPSNPAEMDFGTAPAIQATLQRMVDLQQYGYSTRGADGLGGRTIASFVRRMERTFGWAVDAEQVVLLSDLVQGVAAGLVAFSKPGSGVALQIPSYPAFLMAIAQAGRRAVHNPMRDTGSRFEIDAESIQPAAGDDTRILLLCHPQNPTGRVFGVEELAPLVQLASARDLVIISDEIHADLMFDGRRHVPFVKMFPEAAARTITLYSATKSFNIPGLRCGVMHFGSVALKERFHETLPPALLGTPSVAGMLATIAAWDEGEAWCRDLIAVLEANRDHLLARMSAELPEVGLYRPEATYLAWADFGAFAASARPYERLLEAGRVGGGDGRNFGPGYDSFVRLNFATSRALLDEKIDRIVRTFRANAA